MYNFAEQTTLHISRTKFPMKWKKLTTMNMGKLTPITAIEVIPGDTFKMKMNLLVRAQTLIKPLMDNMWMQISWFFIPNRILDPHWEEIMGENKDGPWIKNKTTYEVPRLYAPAGGWDNGTIADHLGIATKKPGLEINSYYTKGYCQIWNDFYRDENIQNFTHITKEGDLQGSNGSNYVTDAELGGALLPVGKKHDMFTSCLPEPQKGVDVLLPLGESAPIIGNSGLKLIGDAGNGNTYTGILSTVNSVQPGETATVGFYNDGPTNTLGQNGLKYHSGLEVDLSNATAASVNQLRMAIALQQMYELDARGGTRYTEIIKNHFGVQSSDARLQRAEYLGGKIVPVQISQVIQTSASEDNTSPQGNVAGMSITFDSNDDYFTKSFEEHGIIIGCCAIKQEHSYQQGLPRQFSRFKRTDYYDPIFANIGEQPIFNREIYAQGNEKDDEVFGYNEAWIDYKYKANQVSGEFRSNDENTLDFWHLADDFSSLPTLGEDFIIETTNNLDRALTVPSTKQDQFIADFYFDAVAVRPMPPHSVPGLKRL